MVSGVKWLPRKVSTVYRRRFAIELSYRMRNIVKPKTSSKSDGIRYFYALISFLLKIHMVIPSEKTLYDCKKRSSGRR